MKLHEYQAKRLLSDAGVPVPSGIIASTADEATAAFETLQQGASAPAGASGFACQVKAQVHAGGRGKAGGVLTARSPQEAAAQAGRLLGRRLVTHQTGPEGLPVSRVLVEAQVAVKHERYLALTLDRFNATPIILASRRGGVDIEAVAVSEPQAIHREPLEITEGPSPAAMTRVATALGCSGDQDEACRRIVQAMWSLFLSCDASLVELNPLVVTTQGALLSLDAKLTLDDNALVRHPDLAVLRDEAQEHPLELQAGRIGISYVGLNGNIGCLVNGAGLAMATNDIITLCGGAPANFLDVGGGANVEQVSRAFAILLSDPRVRAVLVNIFGGIMRCDWIAQGLLNATQQLDVTVPIVVRLQGTNVEEGRRLLRQAGRFNLVSADELEEAARKAVALANGV